MTSLFKLLCNLGQIGVEFVGLAHPSLMAGIGKTLGAYCNFLRAVVFGDALCPASEGLCCAVHINFVKCVVAICGNREDEFVDVHFIRRRSESVIAAVGIHPAIPAPDGAALYTSTLGTPGGAVGGYNLACVITPIASRHNKSEVADPGIRPMLARDCVIELRDCHSDWINFVFHHADTITYPLM